ncbi:MAG: hypothetical protein K2V38_17755 [Gemmataceae bacterium]|nr:hypothetical protein [Gemmataceae bacterium]
MLGLMLAVGVTAAPHAFFAPELDFSSVPAPADRPKFYRITIEALLASGQTEKTGFLTTDDPAGKLCEQAARWCENNDLRMRLDRLKLTLLDVEGDPIVGLKVSAVGTDEFGNSAPLAPPTLRWVRRPAPPKVTWTYLAAGPRGSGLLGRATAGAFAAAVTAVAAPELDFSSLPDGKDRPQVYSVFVYPRLASGDYREKPFHSFRVWGDDRPLVSMFNNCHHWGDYAYEMRTDVKRLRIALLDYVQPAEDGTPRRDRVVGLTIESNGPAPKVRWTLRPEVREMLDKKK